MQSIQELETNLTTYYAQLQQARQLAASDPSNEEYSTIVQDLEEVINLTADLLTEARSAASAAPPLPVVPPSQALTAALNVGVRKPEPRVVLKKTPEGRLPIGSKVDALYREDGEWYKAMIEDFTGTGYLIKYDDFEDKEEVMVEQVRLAEGPGTNPLADAEKVAEEARLALKRKIAEAAEKDVDMPKDLPKSLRINPDDSEEVRATKRKKIHQWKSKQRFEKLEVTQNKRQNAWQQFQTSGSKKKAGFFTGKKKESIFKSPDDLSGKVGVVGSGKGLTDFTGRQKHLHSRQDNDT
eukprot:TRINITY_DN4137_c0_g1_i1.p1 TRINITY_DN4137_c0_g1~~TRINITY_DN4137_c0_g1_i1.p1  ORF type:complete len:296 (+),score=86.75 TRINITY_DN4137_c0_g1_i1:280-1167(+)